LCGEKGTKGQREKGGGAQPEMGQEKGEEEEGRDVPGVGELGATAGRKSGKTYRGGTRGKREGT